MIGYPEYTINVKTGRVPVNIGIMMTRSKDIGEIDAPDVTASAVLAAEPSPIFIIGINDLFSHYHQQPNIEDKIFSLSVSFSFCFFYSYLIYNFKKGCQQTLNAASYEGIK